jgi:hypothetical protein
MFGSKYESFHPRVACCLDYLIGVKVGWIKSGGGLVSIAPLFIGEGVYGEVNKSVELHLVPAELTE